ncbi:MAG TPA: hypothetical protein GX004_08810 [Firmicutes bacterium]|jgi:O-antigen ligase|nr:hypothetical protein [Bacillota bacterium]
MKENGVSFLRYFLLMLYSLLVLFIPFAIRVREVEFVSPVETWQSLTSKTVYDVFVQFRFEVLTALAVLILITALLKYYYEYGKREINNSYLDHYVLIFALLILLSGLLSPYINIAFRGYYTRCEGVFAYLSYMIIFLVAANMLDREDDKKYIFYLTLMAGTLMSLLGITQFLGLDFLKHPQVMRFWVPAEYLQDIEVSFKETYKAFGTTSNPNYLGGYMAMMFPIAAGYYLFIKERWKAVIAFIITIITFLGLLSSVSAGAFIAVFASLLCVMIINIKYIRGYSIRLLSIILIIIFLGAAINIASEGEITKRLDNITSKIAGDLQLLWVAENEPETDGASNTLIAERNPLDKIASNRGYIWRKSLEMIASNNLIIGSGMDTYIYYFPHMDEARDPATFTITRLIDKPHNMYLHIAQGAGMIALIVYLIMLCLHFIKSVKILNIVDPSEESGAIFIALLSGWLGYLFQGLSNDSVLASAPVYWATFGMGVNYVKHFISNRNEVKTVAVKMEKQGKQLYSKKKKRKK